MKDGTYLLAALCLIFVALYACEMRERAVNGDQDKKHMLESRVKGDFWQ